MAIPTITSIQPTRGPASGQTLITIMGTGMRLPPPPAGRPTMVGGLPQTVEIRIGAQPATRVLVREGATNAGGTIATCLTPAGTPGPADIRIQNLDDAGQPIVGEAVLLPGAFTYERTALSTESSLTRLVRTLLRALKAQVIENVNLTVHTDFDAAPENGVHVAAVARLPALVLAGPELRQSRTYSINQQPVRSVPDGLALHRVPYTVDVGFTLIGMTDRTAELLNLMSLCTLFLHKNKHLLVGREPDAPETGHVAYEMDFAPGGQFQVRSQPSESNVRHFVGELVIRGFDIDEPNGIAIEHVYASSAIELGTDRLED
jgi:IPT/TIG domain